MRHHPRRPRTLCSTALLLLGLLYAGGCARYTDYSSFITETRPLVTATEYRLGPPDAILIHSKRVREIHNHQEVIRPDGKITLPLLGSVFVAGKTCEEISAELQQMAREYYEDADVSLRVASFASKQFFVFGEVQAPGPYDYDGANTVLETLARAQPTRLADPGRIHILRPRRDGQPAKRMTIDLNKMVKEGDTSLDAVLEEGDVLYVPANGLAAVGLAFQQLLLPLQPAASTVQAPASIDATAGRSPYRRGASTPN